MFWAFTAGMSGAAPVLYKADTLTPREHEVAELVIEGLGNRAIADRLFIALPTVKNHLHTIYEKLGVPNRTTLIRTFLRPRDGAGAESGRP